MSEKREGVGDRSCRFAALVDTDGTLLDVNDPALEFGDVERADAVGSKLWETAWFDGSGARDRVEAAVERAASGEFLREEFELRGANGAIRVDLSVTTRERDDGGRELVLEGRDVSASAAGAGAAGVSGYPLDESSRLVTYELDGDETPSEAIVGAFLALDVDVFEGADPLADWLDVDALERFARECRGPFALATRVWDYPVVVTADAVRVYADR